MLVTERQQVGLPPGTKVPNHVALICDGNRRWARAKGKPTLLGHKAGFEAAKRIARASRGMGIHTMTAWIFSTENWDRSPEEIAYLMDLYREFIRTARKEAHEDGVRIVHLGRKDRLPSDLVQMISEVEEETKTNQKHVLNIALDYGGKDEILRAIDRYVNEIGTGVAKSRLTEKEFERYLDTGDQPYPYVDLLIRTSGEQRTSGLLTWQAAYAELYFEIDHLPDFSPEKLREAVLDYSRRRRRFGGNDKEEHMRFNPKLVAKLELDVRRALSAGQNERLRDLVVAYVKEQYGLSKELAKTAGYHLASAMVSGKQEEWKEAKKALVGLYEIVKKNLGLAMEPELVADLQVGFWQKDGNESDLRRLYSETYRVSDLQASKSAHLAYLADVEIKKNNFERARAYLEMFYAALKERVA